MFQRFTRCRAQCSEVRARYTPLTPLISGCRRQLSHDDPSYPPHPSPPTKRTVIEAQTKSDAHSSLLTHRAGLDFQREAKKKKRKSDGKRNCRQSRHCWCNSRHRHYRRTLVSRRPNAARTIAPVGRARIFQDSGADKLSPLSSPKRWPAQKPFAWAVEPFRRARASPVDDSMMAARREGG